MKTIANSHRAGAKLANAPYPSIAAGRVAKLLTHCPVAKETPLTVVEGLAGSATLWVKDERSRMGLGSFKALGAAYVIARHAAERSDAPDATTLQGETYITASAGNHGLSVAAGAKVFGAAAIICLADTVPESFAQRLVSLGAEVRRAGPDYASAMAAAQTGAAQDGLTLLSDSSWDGYIDLPHLLMEGYTHMAAEAVAQCPAVPTHIILQAGVGGMAAAMAAYLRGAYGDAPRIIVVEPENAPALQASIVAGRAVVADGPDSVMGRLDCKEPSLIALNGLARDADDFVTLSDAAVSSELPALAASGLETSPSGGAGVALAMMAQARARFDIGNDARVLTFLSEGPA